MVYILYLAVFINLIIIACFDFKTYKIPNKTLVSLLILGLVYGFFFSEGFLFSFLGFLFGGVFSIIIYLLSKDDLGEGDVKLITVIGLFLGFYKTILFILFSNIIQLFIFLLLNVGFKKKLPFAPALCFSAVLTFLLI